MWALILDWLLTLLGFLWVKRNTKGKLWCNRFSAALAAVLFLGINHGLNYWLHSFVHLSPKEPRIIFVILSVGVVPTTSALTLVLGNLFIPFFEIEKNNLFRCSIRLTGWVFVSYFLGYLLKQLVILLMFCLFAGDMPRMKSRLFNDEFYY